MEFGDLYVYYFLSESKNESKNDNFESKRMRKKLDSLNN